MVSSISSNYVLFLLLGQRKLKHDLKTDIEVNPVSQELVFQAALRGLHVRRSL